MPYAVVVTTAARRQLRSLPRNVQERVASAIESLPVTPRPEGCQKLTGREQQYRLRVGAYRLIYSVSDNDEVVTLLTIAHRREVYRR